MRIAAITGTVTLSRCHPTFKGARLRLAVPYGYEELCDSAAPCGGTMVLWDELGAGVGSLVAASEGREAAQPFHPNIKPVDAYNAAILDHLEVTRLP